MFCIRLHVLAYTVAVTIGAPLMADPIFFSTGGVDGRMAMASRPEGNGKIEIEAADDFLLGSSANITNATFTGLLPSSAGSSSVSRVVAEIYRVFPKDSQNPPSNNVPTRVNSPSDVAFETRDSDSGLTFNTTVLNSNFTALNSVLNGIHPKPNQQTLGEGPVSGQEVEFSLLFSNPFDLPADHYFFIPQVQLDNGEFYWLSSVRPIVAPGTPFAPDLQAWIRNANLDPDWLRVGTDIVGGDPAPTFNGAFTLTGESTPEPSSMLLLGGGLACLVGLLRARKCRSL